MTVPSNEMDPGNLGYYRFPALYDQTLVFTAEGDLWKMDLSHNLAHRLTTHHGMEQFAHISPDGHWVAFTGEYDGLSEVYVIPLQGGIPHRLTYESIGDIQVAGWTQGGKVLYTTYHYSTLPNRQLASVDPKTLEVEVLPLHQASDGCFDDKEEILFFTRLPFQGSHTKRYKGGEVENIWKYVNGTEEASPLTGDYPGTSKNPIFFKNRVYFLSDRDGTMNIWSMTKNGKGLRQHTYSKGWDLKSLNGWQGKFVYQKGADIYLWDQGTKEEQKLEILLSSDFDQKRKRWVRNPYAMLSYLDISPNGKSVALTARGRVFIAPVKKGRMIELTRKQGVRYGKGSFIDENSLVMLSDESGEVELWETPADRPDVHEPLTAHSASRIMKIAVSPKGDHIAYANKDQELWVFHRPSGTRILADSSAYDVHYNLSWSPDGQWLCYVNIVENLNEQIMLFHPASQKRVPITTERLDSYIPSWSPDGKWLYFVSDREFTPIVRSPWGPRQPEPFYDRTAQIYALALRKGLRFPFQEHDEFAPVPESKKGKNNGKKDPPVRVKIDLDGLMGRLYELPLTSGNFADLAIGHDFLYWMEREAKDIREWDLYAFKIGNNPHQEPVLIASDVLGFSLTRDKKKVLVRRRNGIFVFNADGKPMSSTRSKVSLDRWQFQLDPKEEWRQMFIDAWRMERDYFYDKQLHGLDWEAELKKHLPLVDRISDRYELDDLLAHMVSELSALHMYVGGGDKRRSRDYNYPGYLGARLVRHEATQGFKIQHIFKADPDHPNEMSPLARPGLNIKEGDVIQAVDGVRVEEAEHIGELLLNKTHKQVRLSLLTRKDPEETREVIVKPIGPYTFSGLRYNEWVYTRRLAVEKMGKGKIGYVHLKAMGGRNYTEWIRQFYPVYHLPGLIIDVRNNGGGNIDSWILGKLLRKAWAYYQPRVGKPYWGMQYAFRGHMAVICNEKTASDGEAFSEGFRRLGLGKVIGTRTWGGNIWLNFSNTLVDQGIATAAQIGVYSPEGEWLIEGHGVDPDIVVDNLPHETFKGRDRQLESAISHIQNLLAEDPREVPPTPPYPDKKFAYGE